MSDGIVPSGILAAAPLDGWDIGPERLPLAVLPCLARRDDRLGAYGFGFGTDEP